MKNIRNRSKGNIFKTSRYIMFSEKHYLVQCDLHGGWLRVFPLCKRTDFVLLPVLKRKCHNATYITSPLFVIHFSLFLCLLIYSAYVFPLLFVLGRISVAPSSTASLALIPVNVAITSLPNTTPGQQVVSHTRHLIRPTHRGPNQAPTWQPILRDYCSES